MPKPELRKPQFKVRAWQVPGPTPCFPILPWRRTASGLETDRLPGTVFFISEMGLFLTAAHNIHQVDDPTGLRILFIEGSRLVPSPFIYECHTDFDVAIGFAPFPEGFTAMRMRIGERRLQAGAEVASYGFGEHIFVEHEGAVSGTAGLTANLWPALRKGTVLDFAPDGIGLARGPAYCHSIFTPGGNSGGPLLDLSTSAAHAIMGSGVEPADITEAYGIASAIEAILDWPTNVPLIGEMVSGTTTLRALASHHLVTLVD